MGSDARFAVGDQVYEVGGYGIRGRVVEVLDRWHTGVITYRVEWSDRHRDSEHFADQIMPAGDAE